MYIAIEYKNQINQVSWSVPQIAQVLLELFSSAAIMLPVSRSAGKPLAGGSVLFFSSSTLINNLTTLCSVIRSWVVRRRLADWLVSVAMGMSTILSRFFLSIDQKSVLAEVFIRCKGRVGWVPCGLFCSPAVEEVELLDEWSAPRVPAVKGLNTSPSDSDSGMSSRLPMGNIVKVEVAMQHLVMFICHAARAPEAVTLAVHAGAS